MSKQSEAKKNQMYDPKPMQPMCSNCASYSSEMLDNGYGYFQEKNKRCLIGGFAITKTATCNKHSFRKD